MAAVVAPAVEQADAAATQPRMNDPARRPPPPTELDTEFTRGLNLFDATMVVVGSMIGSGIFIVSADMGRLLGSAGWLLAAWVVTGLLTVTAALSYGELAAMMPRAGGQYIYLREAFSPLCGFLYGWTLVLVIQTGTIAAVAVAFARFLGVLWPAVHEAAYLVPPVPMAPGYALSLSAAQAVALGLIAVLTWNNMRGLRHGRRVQNLFTTAKTGALLGLVAAGVIGWQAPAVERNFAAPWTPQHPHEIVPGLAATTAWGLVVAIGIAQVGSLFASDAWNNVTFTAGEVKNPRRNVPLSLALGTAIVIGLYLAANVAYLVTLPLEALQQAPADRVGAAALDAVFPGLGAPLMAGAIMVSSLGCANGLILAGARACYAMARDGLFFRVAGTLNRAAVPAAALVLQGAWAAVLVLVRTVDGRTGTYGNLYSNLLDYVVSAALLFYVLTILGLFRLRRIAPHAPRPYRAVGYPLVPALYVAGAGALLAILLAYRPATTWPGFVIVLLGVPVYWVWRRRLAVATRDVPVAAE